VKKAIAYDANFTAGGIFFNEYSALKDHLLDEEFIGLLKNEIQENKILGVATLSARKRIVSEIIRRYNTMPKSFWELFQHLNEQETKLALFYVCLKTYPIVFDLHFNVSVLLEKKGEMLNDFSVQMRLDELSTSSTEIGSWSITTLKKINTQYRKALKDTELVKQGNLVKPFLVSDSFWEYFKSTNEAWFLQACFIY
jgi:hypothetical protein